jgi:hypothetical protein
LSSANKKLGLAEPSLTPSSSSSWTGTSEEGNGSDSAEAKTRRYCCYGCVPLRLAVVGVLLAELLLIVQQVRSFFFCYNCFQIHKFGLYFAVIHFLRENDKIPMIWSIKLATFSWNFEP